MTVSGTAEIGATLTVNGVAVTVDGSGIWSTSVTAPLVEGPLTVTAVADRCGGQRRDGDPHLTVDMVAPALSITSIPENGGGGINASEASDGTRSVVGGQAPRRWRATG